MLVAQKAITDALMGTESITTVDHLISDIPQANATEPLPNIRPIRSTVTTQSTSTPSAATVKQ